MAAAAGGYATPAHVLVPASIGDEPAAAASAGPDLERARRLLDAAREARGGTLPALRLTGYGAAAEVLDLVQQDLQALGLRVERIERPDWDAEQAGAAGPGVPRFDLAARSWWPDYPEPSTYLYTLLASEQAGPAGNWGAYRDPRYDHLLALAMRTQDRTQRLQLYRQAERHALEQVAAIPLFHEAEALLVQPRWQDRVVLSPLGRILPPLR
jgi:ABC-type transport system substrate-binding protein